MEGESVKKDEQYLYLIFDDWGWGYSIHKIDLSFANSKQPMGTSMSSSNSLPPHSIRIQSMRRQPKYFASAFGSKILFMQPINSSWLDLSNPGMPVYDVCLQQVMIGPRPIKDPVDPIYLPVGGKLFALAADSFQLLHSPPSEVDGKEDFVWKWHALPDPPFKREHVTSYAVHSDGRTIFVSTGGEGCSPGTFSFDTVKSVRSEWIWRQHGHWQLPFYGQGYFVPELEAWVGLSEKPGMPNCRICSTDVISNKRKISPCDQEVKFTKERLCSSAIGFIGCALVSMGGGNKFCSVEYYSDFHGGSNASVGLIMFSVNYDKNGDLAIDKIHQFRFPAPPGVSEAMLQNPVAYWM